MRKFWAVANVIGPNTSGTIGASVSFDGLITVEVIQQIQHNIKTNPKGTRVPADCTVTLINLIELEA